MSTRRMAAVAAAAMVLALAAQTVAADEGGTFQMVRSYQHEYITIDHGSESYTGGILRGTDTITGSSGAPFAANANSQSECLVFSRSTDAGIALQVMCVSVDEAGDRMYSAGMREQGTIEAGGGGDGRWELRGGTGKYAGIEGQCTYETQYLAGGWVVVIAACEWSRH